MSKWITIGILIVVVWFLWTRFGSKVKSAVSSVV